jgi:hypothetical protein
MKHSVIALALISAVVARPASLPLKKREVPQEHSHRNILNTVNTNLFLDNPDDIQDSVFGLLGAAAASEGAGNIADAGMFYNHSIPKNRSNNLQTAFSKLLLTRLSPTPRQPVMSTA